MTDIEFSQRFAQIQPGSPEAAALAQDLAEDARYPARLAIRLCSGDEKEKEKGQDVLDCLGELALVPLSAAAQFPDLETELWALRTITEELVAFRHRTAPVLKTLLANRQAAPPTPDGFAFRTPEGARVCDLAFVLLHRMLHLQHSVSAFLGASDVERDKQIAAFQQSRPFRAAFEKPS